MAYSDHLCQPTRSSPHEDAQAWNLMDVNRAGQTVLLVALNRDKTRAASRAERNDIRRIDVAKG